MHSQAYVTNRHLLIPRALKSSAPLSSPKPQVGQIIELTCKRLGVEGKGICLSDKGVPSSFVILCNHALPGERFTAEVTSVSSNMAEARVIERLSRNEFYTEPLCQLFGSCGGCTLQSMYDSAALRVKQGLLEETLKRGRVRSMSKAQFLPIVPSNESYGYRNKVTLYWSSDNQGAQSDSQGALSDSQGAPFLGMMVRGSQQIISIPHCHLADANTNSFTHLVEQTVSSIHHEDNRLLPSNHPSGSGIMKHVIIRSGRGSQDDSVMGGKEYLVILVTSKDEPQCLDPIVKALLASPLSSSLVGIVNKVVPSLSRDEEDSDEKAPRKKTARGYWRQRDEESVASLASHLLYGRDHVVESVCGLSFQVSAEAFAQVNTTQCEKLYDRIKEAAELKATDTLLDLYCGTGTIGLTMARQVMQVTGIELSETSVSCAQINASLNGISNASFIAGDCDKIAKRWSEGIMAEVMARQSRIATKHPNHDQSVPRPDVVIIDPARAGATSGVIAYLNLCGCRRIIYVSCNPATAARDLAALCGNEGEKGGKVQQFSSPRFALRSIQGFDMFPQTEHVELMAVLDRIM